VHISWGSDVQKKKEGEAIEKQKKACLPRERGREGDSNGETLLIFGGYQ